MSGEECADSQLGLVDIVDRNSSSSVLDLMEVQKSPQLTGVGKALEDNTPSSDTAPVTQVQNESNAERYIACDASDVDSTHIAGVVPFAPPVLESVQATSPIEATDNIYKLNAETETPYLVDSATVLTSDQAINKSEPTHNIENVDGNSLQAIQYASSEMSENIPEPFEEMHDMGHDGNNLGHLENINSTGNEQQSSEQLIVMSEGSTVTNMQIVSSCVNLSSNTASNTVNDSVQTIVSRDGDMLDVTQREERSSDIGQDSGIVETCVTAPSSGSADVNQQRFETSETITSDALDYVVQPKMSRVDTQVEESNDRVDTDMVDVQQSTAVDQYESAMMVEGTSHVAYDFSNRAVPTFVTWARTEYLRTGSENFLRGCKWSPKGDHLVTNSDDNILRIFNMSTEITDSDASCDIEQQSNTSIKERGTVYDYAWHPSVSSDSEGSIATTCSGKPMHLWDSKTQAIVANYKAFDQYDEITSAYSLSFNPSGTHIFGGYNKSIRIFDVEYPGKKCRLIKTTASKKKLYTQPSQTGIISCFCHSPAMPEVFMAGSYSRQVGVYDLRSEGPTCVFEGQKGGITHMMLSPDGNRLFTGARKDKEIICWDVRNLGSVCFVVLRDVKTNQRMYFDISSSGRYMTSGNDNGTIAFWDLQRPTEHIKGADYLRPVGQFQAHEDCVNGVSFHPDGNLLASCSGQRHFKNFDYKENSNKSSSGSDDSDDDDMIGTGGLDWDFSLRIWRMPLAVK